MSNNAPDYENDLVFPPQEIKSQHELSEQGRQSDVLISTIEKCERLEKQLKIAKKYLSLIKRNVSITSLAYTYVSNAQTGIKELEK